MVAESNQTELRSLRGQEQPTTAGDLEKSYTLLKGLKSNCEFLLLGRRLRTVAVEELFERMEHCVDNAAEILSGMNAEVFYTMFQY